MPGKGLDAVIGRVSNGPEFRSGVSVSTSLAVDENEGGQRDKTATVAGHPNGEANWMTEVSGVMMPRRPVVVFFPMNRPDLKWERTRYDSD